ncbi:hypothetical protein FRC04_005610 [Tulasnella sp. 424]|nr:hypothetical protein FRC04_005610 [Tulasnella sp. 424]KAG8976155.1 hypothetical protein FRC05_004404 [Tulasnella sp. 425]
MIQFPRALSLRQIGQLASIRSISTSFRPLASTAFVTVPNKTVFPPTTSLPTSHLETDLAHAAATTGIAHFTSINGHEAPFGSISKLFDRLYADPHLATRLNSTYMKRGVFKTAGLHKPQADQKTTIDLSAKRLENIQRLAPDLVHDLGADFKEVLEFFNKLERQLVPNVMRASSAVAGVDLEGLHAGRNNNFRLVDYFVKGKQASEEAARCGAHRDYGTFSIILQNGASSGLEYASSTAPSGWKSVPSTDVAVVWGWCASILSNDRIQAAHHRVQSTAADTRRQSAVLFVAPDLDVVLKPLVGTGSRFSQAIRNGEVTVDAFKNYSGKTWRVREGNEDPEPGMPKQDKELLEAFVRG